MSPYLLPFPFLISILREDRRRRREKREQIKEKDEEEGSRERE
jgi:hypothetical protein